jgi:glucose-1-phosphate cytidylyltransferase
MKTVILAGGMGTRISEESHLRPKPMIEVGERPLLWHIMKIYSYYGFNDFIIACGYKGHMIKEYFADYYLHNSDVTYDFSNGGGITVHSNVAEPWRVTLVDTGFRTMTGGRIKRLAKYIGDEEFMLTYGDGVADIDIPALLAEHKRNGLLATITAIQPGGRFGVLDLDESKNRVVGFREKSTEDASWINGGFMVLNPKVIDYIDGDDTFFEREPLERLSADRQLGVYRHRGFWQCMDTQRDKGMLEELWDKNKAPWKMWSGAAPAGVSRA